MEDAAITPCCHFNRVPERKFQIWQQCNCLCVCVCVCEGGPGENGVRAHQADLHDHWSPPAEAGGGQEPDGVLPYFHR